MTPTVPLSLLPNDVTTTAPQQQWCGVVGPLSRRRPLQCWWCCGVVAGNQFVLATAPCSSCPPGHRAVPHSYTNSLVAHAGQTCRLCLTMWCMESMIFLAKSMLLWTGFEASWLTLCIVQRGSLSRVFSNIHSEHCQTWLTCLMLGQYWERERIQMQWVPPLS